ncbi:helix-turn-helix transcriptional regulator [Aeromonas rivipollensis]
MNLNFRGLTTIKQVAERNGVSTATVRRWINKGTLPRPVLVVGNTLCWSEKALNTYMARKAHVAQLNGAKK